MKESLHFQLILLSIHYFPTYSYIIIIIFIIIIIIIFHLAIHQQLKYFL